MGNQLCIWSIETKNKLRKEEIDFTNPAETTRTTLYYCLACAGTADAARERTCPYYAIASDDDEEVEKLTDDEVERYRAGLRELLPGVRI